MILFVVSHLYSTAAGVFRVRSLDVRLSLNMSLKLGCEQHILIYYFDVDYYVSTKQKSINIPKTNRS